MSRGSLALYFQLLEPFKEFTSDAWDANIFDRGIPSEEEH
jgi:hypothetical protein